jgi:hypothetical protein
MRLAVAAVAAVAAAGALLVPAGSTLPGAEPRLAGPPATLVQYGYVRSLTRAGGAFRMRFDPALWLTGETANRAAIEDGVISPGDTVPNDYYIRNESRRSLVYDVPPGARATILTIPGSGPRSTRIAVAELAAIVRGGNPRGRKLYARDLGYWIRVVGDRVGRLDQQYQP